MSTPDQFVEQKLNARVQEIEKLFAHVRYPEPYGSVEIVGGMAKLKGEPAPLPDVEVQTIYFVRVASSGIVPHDKVPTSLETFDTPELAYAAWSQNMDRFLSENPGRDMLFWRHRPELERDNMFETKKTLWQVYSRLGVC